MKVSFFLTGPSHNPKINHPLQQMMSINVRVEGGIEFVGLCQHGLSDG